MSFDIDTYDLDYSLANEVLGPELNKLLSEYERLNWPKYPSNLESAEEWKEILIKIAWTFSNYSSPPDIGKYDFDVNWNSVGKDGYGNTKMEVEIVGEEEYARYTKDVEEFDKRIDEGLRLFGQHYKSLWI